MYRLLIIEDDLLLAQTLSECFDRRLYHICICLEGLKGYKKARNDKFDLLIVDWMLPQKSGIDIIKQLRLNDIQTPALIITSKNNIHDIVTALKAGSDGYLCKPFNLLEFKTRVESMLKRPPHLKKIILSHRNIFLDTNSCTTTVSGKPCLLRKKEYQILKYMLENLDTTLTREQIISNVWPDSNEPFIASVDVHINRLRKKLNSNGRNSLIQTVHGIGYKISG